MAAGSRLNTLFTLDHSAIRLLPEMAAAAQFCRNPAHPAAVRRRTAVQHATATMTARMLASTAKMRCVFVRAHDWRAADLPAGAIRHLAVQEPP
jgi:hypothetical protein